MPAYQRSPSEVIEIFDQQMGKAYPMNKRRADLLCSCYPSRFTYFTEPSAEPQPVTEQENNTMPKTAEPMAEFQKPKEGFSIVKIISHKTTTGKDHPEWGPQEEISFESEQEKSADGVTPLQGRCWVSHKNRKAQDEALAAGLIIATHFAPDGTFDEWEVADGARVGVFVQGGKIKSYAKV